MYISLVCARERESGRLVSLRQRWHWLVFLGRWVEPALPLRFSAAIGIFPRHFCLRVTSTNGSNGPPTCLSWLSPGRSMWNPTQTLIKLYERPDRHPHWNLRATSGHILILSDRPSANTISGWKSAFKWANKSPLESNSHSLHHLRSYVWHIYFEPISWAVNELQENGNADWLMAPHEYQDQIIQCEK